MRRPGELTKYVNKKSLHKLLKMSHTMRTYNGAFTRNNRVVIFGDGGSGKSAIFSRIKDGNFSDEYTPTEITEHFTYTNAELSTETIKELNIWDTSGQDQFRPEVQMYAKKADIAILVTDALNRKSLQKLSSWFSMVMKANRGEIRPSFLVLRNKKDLGIEGEEQKISDTLAHERHCDVIMVSAKTGEGFDELVPRLYEIFKERMETPPPVCLGNAGSEKCKC